MEGRAAHRPTHPLNPICRKQMRRPVVATQMESQKVQAGSSAAHVQNALELHDKSRTLILIRLIPHLQPPSPRTSTAHPLVPQLVGT